MTNTKRICTLVLGILTLTWIAGCTPSNADSKEEPGFGEQLSQQIVASLLDSAKQSMEDSMNFRYPVSKEFREQQIDKLVTEQVKEYVTLQR